MIQGLMIGLCVIAAVIVVYYVVGIIVMFLWPDCGWFFDKDDYE